MDTFPKHRRNIQHLLIIVLLDLVCSMYDILYIRNIRFMLYVLYFIYAM